MGKTIAEKIFDVHLKERPDKDVYVLGLDAVFCHEITTPLAITELERKERDTVFDPGRIKAVIDHVSPAKDSKTALQGKILRDWCRRHGIKDFFDIGRNGVCHALFPEQGFVRPGYTIIMGDSHTCTHGAFGAFAVGVGTTDLAVGILKGVCAFSFPKSFKIEINGTLAPGVFAKDLILHIIGKTGVNGATGMVMEFSGSTIESMSMEARMTLCNMAVEAGATCGICSPDLTTAEYLWPHIKGEYASPHDAEADFVQWVSDPDAHYEKRLRIDATGVVPLVTYGFKPDNVVPVDEIEEIRVDQVYIGSCTNGRIEDLRVAASVLKGKRIAEGVRGIVSPATPSVFRQAMDEGIIKIFMEAGFCVTNPTCGACLGMSNGVLAEGEICVSTTNRNFYGRMGKGGMVHLASPATAAAAALAGKITNSPLYKG